MVASQSDLAFLSAGRDAQLHDAQLHDDVCYADVHNTHAQKLTVIAAESNIKLEGVSLFPILF